MSDDEEKRQQNLNWANAIPLVSLIVVVFGAGALVNEQRNLRKAVDEQTEAMKGLASDLRDIANKSDTRIRAIEDWKTEHMASSSPLMQKFLERELRSIRNKESRKE
jgi:Sec-independent protein translocase protein TatA